MKPTLADAIALAAIAHKGATDKAGETYILHPLRVMMDPTLTTEEERITAVLHDVVEDTEITLEDLRKEGYSEDVVNALGFLSKLPEEGHDYHAFIERIARGPTLSIKVKRADLRDNRNLARIPNPTEKDYKRQAKYDRALARLESVE